MLLAPARGDRRLESGDAKTRCLPKSSAATYIDSLLRGRQGLGNFIFARFAKSLIRTPARGKLRYYNPAYSFFAATSMGKSASAFFQTSNSASYAFFASALSPAIAYARASPS
jgi:hypothetical protein